MDTINVIPFIDIMLVLLAIVLTTATFLVEGRLDIRLPKAAVEPRPEITEPVEIGIGAGGNTTSTPHRWSWIHWPCTSRPWTPQTAIVLRVDAHAQFERFVTIVDLLKQRGLERVSILTRDQ